MTHRFPALTAPPPAAADPGAPHAGLIVVDGDPLAEPALLSDPRRIWLVWQQGVPVAGQDFNERGR